MRTDRKIHVHLFVALLVSRMPCVCVGACVMHGFLGGRQARQRVCVYQCEPRQINNEHVRIKGAISHQLHCVLTT